MTYGTDAANMLCHVVNDRHRRRRAMVFTTNKPLAGWGRVLHDEDLAHAITDRIFERGRQLTLHGPSIRTRDLGLEDSLSSEGSAQAARIPGTHKSGVDAMGSIVERIRPEPASLFFREHEIRYEFAASHAKVGLTLDVAVGTGYGADLLSLRLRSRVVGVDIYLPGLQRARRDYASSRILFLAGDGTRLPFASTSFQNAVSLETIEHIADDVAFLGELRRVVRPDGVCIVSTPNREYSLSHKIVNPYHIREYSEDEFQTMLLRFFREVRMYYQGFTAEYHAQVDSYSRLLQERKRHLSTLKRAVVNLVYRPARHLVPTRVTNLFIRRWLGLAYPQARQVHVCIAPEPLRDTSAFVAMAALPRVR